MTHANDAIPHPGIWHMQHIIRPVLLLAAAIAVSACVRKDSREVMGASIVAEGRGLWEKATFSLDSAAKLALARVPGGRITKGELEEEDGKLIYSFDVAVEGKSGIEEVHVDARTGEVIAVKHEGE